LGPVVAILELGLGAVLVAVGILLLAMELAHPGALLFIPASVLIVGGFLYIALPDVLLRSAVGVLIVLAVAVGAGLLEIPYYRLVAPTHKPMTTTSAGFAGEEAIVTVDIVPNTLKGKVRVRSEIWSANSTVPIPAGARVRIVQGEGVSLTVVPVLPPPSS
jgi:inner membrane protein